MAFRKSRYLIEHERRVAHLPLINVDEGTDFLFGLGALDEFQFARRLNAADPVTQILIGHVQSPPLRRRRLRDQLHANVAATSRPIFDDKGLSPFLIELLRNNSPDRVDRTTRLKWGYDPNRSRW